MERQQKYTDGSIAALILAAGMSQRMGQPKMVLPWGNETVIGHVVSQVLGAGLNQVYVVLGGAREKVEAALREKPVKFVINPSYMDGEMLHSLQAGIRAIPERCGAALVVLGDQPQIKVNVIEQVLLEYRRKPAGLVIPSYKMHRGHPWLIDRALWPDLLNITPPSTFRDFINQNQAQIKYVSLDEASILADLDTPADYERQRPGG